MILTVLFSKNKNDAAKIIILACHESYRDLSVLEKNVSMIFIFLLFIYLFLFIYFLQFHAALLENCMFGCGHICVFVLSCSP